MKVFIISTICNAHVIRWSRMLLNKGYDITVISSEPNEWGVSDIPIIECLAKHSQFGTINFWRQFLRTIRICKILKKEKPEIVHIHSLDYIHPFMVGLIDQLSNCFQKLIVSTWGTDVISTQRPSSSVWGTFSKKVLLSRAREITTTTKFLAKITANLTSEYRKIHIIPFGIDCKMFNVKNDKSENFIHIGFVKHLLPKYGPDILLSAAAVVIKKYPNTKLTMVGHGKMDGILKEMAVNLGIQKNVNFVGYMPNEEIPEIMSHFDIFVMPTVEKEAFGVAAIEAQAQEIPVVASNIGGIPEAVIDRKTGLLIEPKNVQKLADAIIDLIENPNTRYAMGKKGREFVLKNYNLDENVKSFEQLYNDLCESNVPDYLNR